MKITRIIEHCKPKDIIGNADIEILKLEIDSRKVEKGTAFVAIRGTQVNGHDYIAKAIEQGASAVICEQLPDKMVQNVTYLRYDNTEDAVGSLATEFYGNPTKRIKLIGVTGTNGKTTIATTLYNIVRHMGIKAGLCSTVCNYIDGKPYPTECTTPDPITLNRLLGEMADAGCEYAFMEVSSHSVTQKRIGGLTFAGGLFTNLTRDHLDYHKTFENYRDAKKGFFDMLPKDAFAITNADDRNGMVMTQNTKATVKTYSMRGIADFRAKVLEESFDGMNLLFDNTEVFVQFVGRFNVQNLLAVYGTLRMIGINKQDALVELSAMKPVNGRFETIRSNNGVTAIIDYAHTPDAIANVLSTINEVLQGKGQCWTVCGARQTSINGPRGRQAE